MEFRKAQFAKRSYRNSRNDRNQKGELGSGRGGSRYNRDSRSVDSRFGRNDRGPRFNRGSEDNRRVEMFEATCGDCGTRCEIPFKPKYDRPVYCRECFKDHKPQESSDSGFSRYDKGSSYNRDSRSVGSRFSRNDRGPRFNRGSEDNRLGEMHNVTCGDCGNECQIPFKPKYDRPVYCRECFKNHKPQESSDSGFSRYDKGSSYNRDSRSVGSRFSRNDRGPRFNRGSEDNQRGEMHKVTCGDCGNECEIPFKPKYDRPVYCRECFKNHKPQESSDSGFSRYDRDRTPIHSRDNFRKHEYQKKTIEYNSNLRPKLFDILDKKECVICGFDDERALGFGQIDDEESFNFVQRENIPSSWKKYVSEPELAKEKIQILCLNCNQLKQEEFND